MKKFTAILALLLALTMLAGCAASMTANDSAANAPMSPNQGTMEEPEYSYDAEMDGGYDAPTADTSDGIVTSTQTSAVKDYSEKIIYTAEANVQTLTFDDSVAAVTALVERFEGFIQSSSVTGKDFYAMSSNRRVYRNATFVLRIPTAGFSGFQTALSELGNVTYLDLDTKNITTDYYDTASRLTTYRTEEERLFEMLGKCETVEDMLAIEQRLSDVRYEIEALTTTLNRYDEKVAYSTITLYLSEVAELTQETPVQRSYGQQIVDGFVDSLRAVGRFFQNLLLVFLSSIPYLVLIGVPIVIVLVLILRAIRKRRTARKLRREQENEE